jgi:ADP-ribose pyrophosphatase YjhB (NUDIX family)
MIRPIRRGVTCYVSDPEQMILMKLRNTHTSDIHHRKYTAIVGRLREEETPEQCVQRKCLDETGLELIGLKRIGKVFYDNYRRTVHGTPLTYDYLCDIFTARTKETCRETESLRRVHPKDMLKLPQHPGDKFIYIFASSGNQFSAEICYTGERVTRWKLD